MEVCETRAGIDRSIDLIESPVMDPNSFEIKYMKKA